MTTTSTFFESEETPSTVITSVPKTVVVDVALVTVFTSLTGTSFDFSMNWITLARTGLLVGMGVGAAVAGEVIVLVPNSPEFRSLGLYVPISVTSLLTLSTFTTIFTCKFVSDNTVTVDWMKLGYSTTCTLAMRSGVAAGYLVEMYLIADDRSGKVAIASGMLLDVTVFSPNWLVVYW